MSEQWHRVDASGHIPGVEAELPPGRVLLDEQGNMIDHDWDEVVVVEDEGAPEGSIIPEHIRRFLESSAEPQSGQILPEALLEQESATPGSPPQTLQEVAPVVETSQPLETVAIPEPSVATEQTEAQPEQQQIAEV